MAVRLYPLCSARRVTAPQAPLTAAAALPIHSSTGKVSIVVSLHDPSDCSLGLIRRLTCYRAAKLSTRFPQKTGVLRRSHQIVMQMEYLVMINNKLRKVLERSCHKPLNSLTF